MAQCPDCEKAVSPEQKFCRECGAELDDVDAAAGEVAEQSFRERVEEIRAERASDGDGAAPDGTLDAEPRGDWVTAKRLEKVVDLLDEVETVHYMWRGRTIDVEGSGAGESLWGNDRDRKTSLKGIFTAVTDKRVVIAIPQFLGDDERHVPYHSVTSVDLDTGLINRRVSLQTKGQTYHVQAQGPSKDELRDAMRFIREKIEAANRPQQVQASSDPDPTEQLRNLKELHDDGVLTDAEFEEKKASILDEL